MRIDSIGEALGSYPKKPVHKSSPATSATAATSSQPYKNKELFPKAPATPSATPATHVATAVERALDTAPELAHDTVPEAPHDGSSENPSERPLSPYQPMELPRLFSGMLMTDQVSGKPLHSIHCGRRRQVEGSAWWVGECDICGECKGAKSRWSIISQVLA